jgi:hypothetical protein
LGTFFAVLPGELSNSVGYLVAHRRWIVGAQGLQELLADGISLGLGDGEEYLLAVLGVGVLARAGRDAAKQDSSKGARLIMRRKRSAF